MLVGALGTIPFFVEVDDYRPEILKAVNSQINGSLNLGKLRLSLWGKVAVGVENAELKDSSNRVVLSVGKFDLRVPLLSVITGRPAVYVDMVHPVISAHRNKKGEWNLLSLSKNQPTQPKNPEDAAPESVGGKKELPSWTQRAIVGLRIFQADLKITDEKNNSDYGMRNLELNADSLSLSQPSSFSLKAQLDSALNESASVKGPFEIKGKVNGEEIVLEAQLQKVVVLFGKQFRKDETVPAYFRVELLRKPQEIEIKEGKIQFHTAKFAIQGNVKNWEAPAGGQLNVSVQTPGVDLASFSALLPGVDKTALQGNLKAKCALEGTTLKPEGLVEAALEGVKVKGENFKQDLEIDGQLKASLQKVEKLAMQFKAEGFDLRLTTQVSDFENPKLRVVGESNEMDLDKLLDWEKMKKANLVRFEKNKAAEVSSDKGGGTGNPIDVPDYDAPLGFLKKNEIVKKTTGEISFVGKSLKFYNVLIEPVRGKFSLGNLRLVGGFEEARIFDGKTKLNMQLEFSSDRPRYSFQVPVSNIELQKAVASQLEILKNTMTGSLSGDISGRGESFNPVLAKKNLVASGKMRITQSKLSSIDLNKILSESAGEMISKVGEKIPALKGKNLQPGSVSSEFQQITGTFSIKDGEFVSPDFFAQAIPQKGVDIRGDTRVGLIDYSLHADWEISDPYNLLKAKEIALEEGGNRVESILLEKGQPFKLPIRVRGTLLSPQYDYGAVPDSLVRIALANISRTAEEKAKAAVKGKAEEEVKKLTEKAPQQIKDVLKGIFK